MKLPFFKETISILLVISSLSVFANEEAESAKEQQEVLESTIDTLQSLLDSTKEKLAAKKLTENELKTAAEETDKEEVTEIMGEMEEEIDKLQLKLESVATGVSVKDYRNKEPERFELQKEFENLLQPMLYALRSVTQDSRQIEQLRQNIESINKKQEMASTAINNLQKLAPKTEASELKSELEKMLSSWQDEEELLKDEESILSQQLKLKLESKGSLVSSTGNIFSGFFKSRGVNFILGLLTMAGVFFLLKLLYSLFKKMRYKNRKRLKTSFERLMDLIFTIGSFIISIVATLFIFNIRNDWLLLGLGTLFLLALGWFLIKSLPSMVEQVMLLLNLGSVREGERLIYNGVPWEVESLNFYTHFYNPELTGGSLHISVRELTGMVSRPSAPSEEWFPSKEGEWVELDDDNLGQVIYQSPEMVELELFGGSHVTYSTESYLGLNPTNLSRGYRIQMVFGVDYKYQAQCTTEVPDKMKAMLKQDLIELLGEGELIKVATDFFAANASSLDFEYEAVIKGSSAYQYEEVERVMIYSFANVCNKYGWEIPFQQITLHQVEA